MYTLIWQNSHPIKFIDETIFISIEVLKEGLHLCIIKWKIYLSQCPCKILLSHAYLTITGASKCIVTKIQECLYDEDLSYIFKTKWAFSDI